MEITSILPWGGVGGGRLLERDMRNLSGRVETIQMVIVYHGGVYMGVYTSVKSH